MKFKRDKTLLALKCRAWAIREWCNFSENKTQEKDSGFELNFG